MPDDEAVSRLKQADINGLETLVKRYQVKAIRAAYFIVQDTQSAEDIVQETFLNIYRHSNTIDASRPIEPYLMRSVVNNALKWVRNHRKVVPLDGKGSMEHVDLLLLQAVSVENQAEKNELSQMILQAIATLPLRQRAAVVQRYYLNMSEAEMAESLHAPPGTIKWLLHAGRIRLRELLNSLRSGI